MWTSDQVAGQVVFEALQQSAGRRAILRDRYAFPVFVEMIRSIEPAVAAAAAKVTQDVDEATVERVADAVRRIFSRVLKELADIDNPMRTALGSEPGEGGLFGGGDTLDGPFPEPPTIPGSHPVGTSRRDTGRVQRARRATRARAGLDGVPARPDRRRSTDLPTIAPDPEPGRVRSRFDAERGVVLFSERHPDYLS